MRKMITLKFVTTGLLIAAFFALSTGVNAQNKKDLKKAQKLTADGNKAFGAKNFRLAIDKYAEAVIAAPNYAEAHFWKGYAHYYLNEYDQALTEVNLAAEQNYNKPLEIYKLRWYLNFQKSNYDEALADVRKGLEIEPGNLTLLVALGDASRKKKDYRTALVAYKKASQMTQVSGDILYYIAESAHGAGDTEEQGTSAAAAVKRGTKFVGEAYYLVGDSLHKSGKTKEALEAYRQALASKDDIYNVYRAMAEIYRKQSRYKDAIDISLKGLGFFPNDGKINSDLSWYYSLSNSPFQAIPIAKSAIGVLPEGSAEQSLAYTNLCRAYSDTKQYSEAVGACSKAIEISPNDSLPYTNLCQTYVEMKQYSSAISACGKALEISPNDGEANFYLGFAYKAADKTKEKEAEKYNLKAIQELENSVKENPDYSETFCVLGSAYVTKGEVNFGDAVEAYKKCLEASPRSPRIRFNLGYVYKTLKKGDLAQQQYDELLKLDPKLAADLKKILDQK